MDAFVVIDANDDGADFFIVSNLSLYWHFILFYFFVGVENLVQNFFFPKKGKNLFQ